MKLILIFKIKTRKIFLSTYQASVKEDVSPFIKLTTSSLSRNLNILPRSLKRIEVPPPHLFIHLTTVTGVPCIFVSRLAIFFASQAMQPGPVHILILSIMAHAFIDIEYQYMLYSL